MRTGKAVSNIAYHRPEVWSNTVNALRKAGVIGPCLWVAHKSEGNEKKDHIHLCLLGGYKSYNTDGLSSLFGIDVIDGQKASVTTLWRTTKSLNDWILYAIHNPRYLIHKGESKQHTYDWGDVHITSGDEDTLQQLIVEAQDALEGLGDKTTMRLRALARMGLTWREVVVGGYVPMGQLMQARTAWRYILQDAQPGKGATDE